MADAADVLFVLDAIEDDYQVHGWSEEDISARLEAGVLKERVVAAYWRKRATQVINLVNTSESGSSRGMDSVYPRMNALAAEWEAKAVEIETPAAEAAEGRLSSFAIRRV